MLAQAIKATEYGNHNLVIDSCSNVHLIRKLIGETDVFKIQPSRNLPESSEFGYIFAKRSTLINTRVSLKNYKMHARRN